MKNGYFQLEVKDRGIFIHFIPPGEGGIQCKVEDIISYLDYHNIVGYNMVEIKRVLDRRAKGQMFLSGSKIPISSESLFVKVSEDKMKAVAKFYPPFVDGRALDKASIRSTLELQGVKTGIKEEVIDRFLADREYCTEYTIAEGIEPQQGRDASIEYFFETNLNAKPQLNDDGSVDFHKLNSISHIKKGTILATLTPEVRGVPGADVLGNPIPPRDVKKAKLSFGKNISYTEDRLSIVSDVDGHVTLVEDKVFVSDTYEVPADVDTSTGDIEYNGNIDVKGCVRSGFMLKASGNITVKGVVEGAVLIADGDIILTCGIQGMGKGVLEAKGNIVTKFIENATVKSGGNITTEAILHSHVTAKDSIMVTGKKGFVTGGKVSAFAMIEAKTIGSAMGAATEISVGIDPQEKEQAQQYQKDLVQLQRELDRLKPVVKKFKTLLTAGAALPVDKLKQIKALMEQYYNYQKEYELIETKLNVILEKESGDKDACICVRDKIYPGVKLVISDCMYIVKDIEQYCRFKRDGVDVKRIGF